MDKIASFQVNHLNLLPGLYVSRKDQKDQLIVTTFDLRFTTPNVEPVIDSAAIHTIEHLGATFLRNSKQKEDVIYFGPMGCRTGFYLVMFGSKGPTEIYQLIIEMCEYIISFEGKIPGATAQECGNYLEQNLPMAQYYIKKYRDELLQNKRFVYVR